MNNIPVSFTFEGKHYSGFLTQVSGGGNASHFHLMIDNYYYGQMIWSQKENDWQFFSNNLPGLSQLTDYFGRVVLAWFE